MYMKIRGLNFKKPSWHGWRIESLTLARVFIPRERNNTLTKLVTLLFVAGWVTITIALTLEDIATVRPIFYGIYTAVVFGIVGRMWGIEIDFLTGD